MLDTERAVIEAMRNHEGGLGESLSKEEYNRIAGICEYSDDCSTCERNKMKPFDAEKFLEGGRHFLENHPIEWIMR